MIATEDIKRKIDEAIKLQNEIAEKTSKLDSIKADIQAEGLKVIENKNLKYVEMQSGENRAFVSFKEKFELDNVNILKEIFGNDIEDKLTREEAVKYKLNSKFQKALMALYSGEFENVDIASVLLGMGLDLDQIKLAKKKLKGEYAKDYATLKSIKPELEEIEEELDAIHAAKNYELISKFCDVKSIDLEKLKRAITVEESLAIGLG